MFESFFLAEYHITHTSFMLLLEQDDIIINTAKYVGVDEQIKGDSCS